MRDPEVNLPAVVAEVETMFRRYEEALVGNDIEALNDLFRVAPETLRYGVGEHLYGHEEIARFRRERGPLDQRRTLRNTRITTFGRDFATAHTEFIPLGGLHAGRVGRQSQVWVRTSAGWKIASAHVSFLA